jgi:hypothetical protein
MSRRTRKRDAAQQPKATNEPGQRAAAVSVTSSLVTVGPTSVEGAAEAWTPSPLALLDDDAYEQRKTLMLRELERTEDIKRSILIEGTEGEGDYGVIPGTQKKALFQSGAEKFNKLAGLQPRYVRECRYGDGETAPDFTFEVECQLVDTQGTVHGSGGGSASNWEKKYRYRSGQLECPQCGGLFVFASRKSDEPGWFCWRAKGGCGENYGPDDERLLSQGSGVSDNPDPFDVFNTVRQMADKRAYVKVTRTTHALSNTFTQDPGGDEGNGGSAAPAGQKKAEKAKRAGRTKVTEGQLRAARERMADRAKTFGDAGVNSTEIEINLCEVFGVKALADLEENELVNLMKAIGQWEPPTS